MNTSAPVQSPPAPRMTAALPFGLAFLRILIGWHLLYEGITKLLDPNWSAAGFLASSQWILSEPFHWMAQNPSALACVDFFNAWGLTLIGAGLMLGVCTRTASLAGAGLLLLYYVAHPPLIGIESAAVAEGSYLVVNKTLVETAALLLLAITPQSGFGGFGRFIKPAWIRLSKLRGKTNWSGESPMHHDPEGFSRRQLIASLVTLPVLGGFVYAVLKKHPPRSREERALQASLASSKSDATTGPSIKIPQALSLDELEHKVPHAKLGDLEISRLILGGNLMNGYAHARDLIYVSSLVSAYHSVDKVLETLWLAEQCGMNALVLNTHKGGHFIEEYQKRNVGKMHFIAQCSAVDLIPRVQGAIDLGVEAAYIQMVEVLTDENKFDEIAQALELMRSNGLVAGYGSHYLSAIKKCSEQGIEPDFCMKTFHHLDYWSAQPDGELRDNRYCDDGEETIEFMKDFEKPWIVFKALAAGSIHPKDGLRYAFENGADFVSIGMYDFQVVEDANIVGNILNSDLKRERPWRALA